jgi:hypothetical protein
VGDQLRNRGLVAPIDLWLQRPSQARRRRPRRGTAVLQAADAIRWIAGDLLKGPYREGAQPGFGEPWSQGSNGVSTVGCNWVAELDALPGCSTLCSFKQPIEIAHANFGLPTGFMTDSRGDPAPRNLRAAGVAAARLTLGLRTITHATGRRTRNARQTAPLTARLTSRAIAAPGRSQGRSRA